MNDNVCYHLFNDFTVSWDPEVLTNSFPVIEATGVYTESSGIAHWQKFDSDVLFARNFTENFMQQCREVSDKIKKIQSELVVNDSSLDILKKFKSHEITPWRVNLLKTIPGKDIKLHVDATRTICLNIGLKNSNKWKTYIFNEKLGSLKDIDVNNIDNYNTRTVTLNDGEGYLFKIENPHTAICLNKQDTDTSRYIITYSL